jgi:hypothetical protein
LGSKSISQGVDYVAAPGSAPGFDQDLQYRKPVLTLRKKASLLFEKGGRGSQLVFVGTSSFLSMI